MRATEVSTRQAGFTLVELMVAATIGLIVTAAVLGTYISASRNYAQDERFARMQENGRYALRVLIEDLVMADFWGKQTSVDTVTTALTPDAGDCGVAIAVFDPGDGILFNNYHASPANEHFTPCATVTGDRLAGTDVIAIKRVEGAPTASTFVDAADTDGDSNTTETITTGASALVDEEIYLRSNGTTGELIDDATSANAPTVGFDDWRYRPRLYFVRDYYDTAGDGVPALCRLDLDEEDLDAVSCLAEGIEDLHLQFGIDTDSDGVANLYTSSPTTAQMSAAASVRVYVLARSTTSDPIYTNAKTYLLGDAAVAAANDGFYRAVFSTTAALRNTANRSRFE